MNDFKNILVVRTDRIGDVILTTPAVKALRQAYPQARLTMLTAPATAELVEGNPHLNEVLVDDRLNSHKGPRGFLRLVKQIREKRFDLAVIFHTKRRTNTLCFWAGIPIRLGYKNEKFGFLLTHPVMDTRREGRCHESEYCLQLLQHLGLNFNAGAMAEDLHVTLKDESEQWAGQFLRQNNIQNGEPLVAIHAGASDPSKRWPVKYFAELIDILVSSYQSKIVLIGAVGIRTLSREIFSLTTSRRQEARGPIFDVTGMTTVSQLASLLKRCRLLVSNDSGPVHLAAAVRVPVVSIFTRNQPGINPERWRPLGEKARVVSVSPSLSVSFTKAGVVDPRDLELIPAQAVLEAVDALWKLC